MKKLLSLILLLSFTIKAQEIKIGTQTWTSKNLNVSTYRNGDAIPQVQDKNAWAKLTTGAWCYYQNNSANGIKYGKLYNWYAVNDPRGLAPEGYHIPSDAEWTILKEYLGDGRFDDVTYTFILGEGEKMKSTSGWDSYSSGGFSKEVTCPNCADWNSEYHSKVACSTCKDNKYVSVYESKKTHSGNGTNTSGFAGLPGGFRAGADVYTTNGWVEQLVTPAGSFDGIYWGACWWSSSEFDTNRAWCRYLENSHTIVKNDKDYKQYGYSIRCLRDGISGEDEKKVNKPFVPVRDGKTETKPVIQKKPVTPPTPTKIEPLKLTPPKRIISPNDIDF